MPKSKLNRPKVDKALALILERKKAYGKTYKQIGAAIKVSDSTMRRMVKQGTQTWTVEQLIKIASFLDIPKDEIRKVI